MGIKNFQKPTKYLNCYSVFWTQWPTGLNQDSHPPFRHQARKLIPKTHRFLDLVVYSFLLDFQTIWDDFQLTCPLYWHRFFAHCFYDSLYRFWYGYCSKMIEARVSPIQKNSQSLTCYRLLHLDHFRVIHNLSNFHSKIRIFLQCQDHFFSRAPHKYQTKNNSQFFARQPSNVLLLVLTPQNPGLS